MLAVSSLPAGPDTGTEDAVLVAAARANRQAFVALYDRYLQPIHRYCYLRLGSREAAEDATSEIFVRAMTGLDGFRGGVFAGWLFRIAHNVVADARRRGRQAGTPLTLDAAGNVADPDLLPEDAAVSRSELDALRAALLRLSDDQRAVLELQLTGLSTPEIAAALGRSQGAVRILRFRGQQRLRDLLSTPDTRTTVGEEGRPC
jgi:RNA polymerase sigma-70 factor (ECF subfamily)